jgi:malonyl-CoA/methylmalonyl-CoA synthetase
VTVLESLDTHAAQTPGARAIDGITYAELRKASMRVAAMLRGRGIVPGSRVTLYAENSLAYVYAYLGVLRAAAVAVPANVLYRAADLARVVGDSGAAVVVHSAASAEHVPDSLGAERLALNEIAAAAASPRFDDAPHAELPTPEADDLALLVYTSGTTGRAKGAMLTHGNLGAIAAQLNAAWRWTSADVLLLTLPLFHVHGLCAGVNGTLAAGARLLLRERFDADDVAATLEAGDATLFFGVPTMYVRLLERPEVSNFSGVRLFVSGSAALPASVHEAFAQRFGASILERYGSTEFGFALTNRYEGPRYPGTVGFPFPGVSVRLAGPGDAAVPEGEIGEILVSGPNVAAGYWQDADGTAAAFFTDSNGARWYRSGDLATFDPERGFAIVGRTKELIITGGFNVYPREVEDELLRLSGIRASAVVGRPDAARGEVPVAFVECDDAFDAAAIEAELRARLASFKVPKAIYRIEALPRNAMGKVDKPHLRALLADSLTTATRQSE